MLLLFFIDIIVSMIHEIEAKKLLITNKHPSSWFGVKYYLNIYRGCMHGCIYCDTRSECYNIDNFDNDISVKTNAIPLLQKELKSKRYRETIGFGSASDPYVPIEKKYELTKQALGIIKSGCGSGRSQYSGTGAAAIYLAFRQYTQCWLLLRGYP